MTQINLIAAMAKNRTIGLDNTMPWHLPADLKHFKAITMKHPIIMGRKTYQSIGRPLPGRQNIVVTRNQDFQLDGADVVNSLDQALGLCQGASEIMVIGGANIYQQMLPKAKRLYLTFIDLDVAGDSYFPDWHGLGFKQIDSESHTADETNPYCYRFVTLEAS
ncbi:MAG: type 3 dihydrofolate reductase [Gammaproteobacteria bacterium]|nr:MAG: type 3 dihydrofolate reductase [Gammaproteobacteria bacterium]